jgi:osmotically-inducible protein OsmY
MILRGSLVLLLCCAMLSGCASLLASMETGPLEDSPYERTLAQQFEDESIETKAIVNLRADDDGYDVAHLVVVSFNGYVLLAGQVESERLQRRATDILRKIHGVRRIYNELEVGVPTTGMTRSNDTWLTTKVKTRMLASPSIEGGRVKVVTENGVVYLMGLVSRDEADRISHTVSGISGVERVVRLFELVG